MTRSEIRFLAAAAILLAGGAARGQTSSRANTNTSTAAKKTAAVAAPTPEGKPCSAAAYRQFDFWLGDWDVVNAAGKPAGKNHVVSLFDGCGLQENWESAQGGRGTSLNVYDAVTGHWHQSWVDDHGGLLELNGGLEEGRMILVGSRPSIKEKGSRVVHRITLTPIGPDRVRQLWEASTNEGRIWSTVFDGTYVRKK